MSSKGIYVNLDFFFSLDLDILFSSFIVNLQLLSTVIDF